VGWSDAYSQNELRETTKSKLIRVLPITIKIRELLQGLKRQGEFVFHQNGKPYPLDGFYKRWKKAANSVRVSVSLYQGIRHSRAGQLVNNGVQLEAIRVLFGHTTGQMTRRYARLETDSLRDILEGQYPNSQKAVSKVNHPIEITGE
jgi:integrase